MERKKKNRPLELGKDLLILALVLSAVYLALRTQFSTQVAGADAPAWVRTLVNWLDHGQGAVVAPGTGESQPVEVRPLRIAVNIADVGRYGIQYDSAAADRLFDEVFSSLLGEALGSARAPQSVTEQVWREALSNRTGVYFDFQGVVPLGALYRWLEAGPGEALMDENVRRLLLAEEESGLLTLYYSNEETGLYYACQTADTLKGHLKNVAASCVSNVNEAVFAYEKKGEAYKTLAPYVMLPGTPVLRRTVYRVANPVALRQEDKAREEMIETMGFHPQSNSSYTGGDRLVVKEGADTLVVYDNGGVDYHSASPEEKRYPVGAEGSELTARQVMSATQDLAEKTVGAWCGEAKLYLMGIEDLGEGHWQVDYGYHLNGVTVRLGEEGYAARFIVSDGRVSDFYLVLRSYAATGDQSAVLPERQAVAGMKALNAGGQELSLVYEDRGSVDTVRAGWIAE